MFSRIKGQRDNNHVQGRCAGEEKKVTWGEECLEPGKTPLEEGRRKKDEETSEWGKAVMT